MGRQGDGESGGRGEETLRVAASLLRDAAHRLIVAGIDPDEATLEAEVLLRHVLGIDRAALVLRKREPMQDDAAQRFADLVARRLTREPLAYITGHREFYGLDFAVDARVLVPRPETEGLVERAIRVAADAPLIVDVGTGSGCIAVALAVHLPQAQVIATDVSTDALALAAENAARHGVSSRVTFRHGDLLQPVGSDVDIIVSNPPYIARGEIEELQPEIARYEPRAALDGGADGLDIVRRLLDQATACLRPGGYMLLEIGTGQGSAVARLAAAAFAGATIEIANDLAGLERYVFVRSVA